MKNPEKNILIERGVELIEKGKALSFIEEEMIKKGYSKYEIYNIFSLLKDYYYQKYNKEIKELIKGGKLKENLDRFSYLGESILNYIKQEVLLDLKREKNKTLIKLIKKGDKTDDIIKMESCDYYDKADIKKYVKDYKKRNNILSPRQKKIAFIVGIVFVAIGLVLFITNPHKKPMKIIYVILTGVASIAASQKDSFK